MTCHNTSVRVVSVVRVALCFCGESSRRCVVGESSVVLLMISRKLEIRSGCLAPQMKAKRLLDKRIRDLNGK